MSRLKFVTESEMAVVVAIVDARPSGTTHIIQVLTQRHRWTRERAVRVITHAAEQKQIGRVNPRADWMTPRQLAELGAGVAKKNYTLRAETTKMSASKESRDAGEGMADYGPMAQRLVAHEHGGRFLCGTPVVLKDGDSWERVRLEARANGGARTRVALKVKP